MEKKLYNKPTCKNHRVETEKMFCLSIPIGQGAGPGGGGQAKENPFSFDDDDDSEASQDTLIPQHKFL